MGKLSDFIEAAKPDPPDVKALRREIQSLKTQLQARMGGEDIIRAAVEQAYAEMPDLSTPAPKLPKGKKPEEIPVLHFSDGQIGKRTATFDSAVAEIRVQRAVQSVAEITEIRRATARIDRLVLLMGGDEVEGENIFPGQAHQIDSGVFEQAVRTAPEIYARAIRSLLQVFPTVEVYEVPGNHGRAAARSIGSHPFTNWDNVTHHTLRVMLAGEKRIIWHPNVHWFQTFPTFGDAHLLVHGDQMRGGFAGYPWYAVGRKALAWSESVKEWRGGRRYLWHGHFHQINNWSLGGIKILGNGSLESTNEYARAEIGFHSHPEQRLAFFNAKHGLIADCPLYLGD